MLELDFSKEKYFLNDGVFFQKNDSFKTMNDLKSSKQIFYLINEFSKRFWKTPNEKKLKNDSF